MRQRRKPFRQSAGGGMFSYFTELNRKHVPLEELGFVTHCTCPIVHAADDLSVMQSLEALPFITHSTRAFIGDKPYWIGPSTIGMRQIPDGSRTMENPKQRTDCYGVVGSPSGWSVCGGVDDRICGAHCCKQSSRYSQSGP